jgi:dUTP pyrophosphatase
MNLNILPVNNDVSEIYSNFASQFNEGDSGFDLFFTEDINLNPNEFGKCISLKIKASMEDEQGNYLSYILCPRSSISKTPVRMSNSIGIIDAGYRGELKVCLDNHSSEPYIIKKNTRLFQICSGDLKPFNFKIVSELNDTDRGDGGFGSTGN